MGTSGLLRHCLGTLELTICSLAMEHLFTCLACEILHVCEPGHDVLYILLLHSCFRPVLKDGQPRIGLHRNISCFLSWQQETHSFMPAAATASKAAPGVAGSLQAPLPIIYPVAHQSTPDSPHCGGHTCAAKEAKRYLAQP